MLDDVDDRSLPRDELAAMVQVVRPEWHLQEAMLSESGWTTLYHLFVETDTGARPFVLKATPVDDRPAGIDVEARVQTILADQTSIPVPAVIGAVDAHQSLRTPYFLMERLPGENISATEIGTLSDSILRRIARETGRYLGQLHDLDVELSMFGEQVDYRFSRRLQGERPSADPARLVVNDGYDRWPRQLHDWFEEDFRELETSRFGDLTPALRAEQTRRVDALPATFRPVLGRTDYHWSNRLVDRECGTLEGVLDWEATPAVTRGFSLAFAEEGLATKRVKPLSNVPDRRPLVWSALQAGYAEETRVPSKLAASRACYRLNLLVRDMAVFDERIESSSTLIPPDRIEEAAADYREAAEAELRRDVP